MSWSRPGDQLDFRGSIGVVHARVDLHAETGEALLVRAQRVERDIALAKLEPHPRQTDLLEEVQVVVGEVFGIQPVAQLRIAGVRLRNGCRPVLREQGHDCRAGHGSQKTAPLHGTTLVQPGSYVNIEICRGFCCMMRSDPPCVYDYLASTSIQR